MKINRSNLKIISKDINEKTNGSYITNIFLLNNSDIVFAFSFYRDEKLLISLNHVSPFVSFISKEIVSPTILNKTNEFLRKEIKDSCIKEVSTFNEDRILKFSLEKRDEFYEKKSFVLLIELIPHRPNMIVLDKDNKVLFATTYTTLDSDRLVLKGMTYQPLEKNDDINVDDSFDYISYKNEANEYIDTSLITRKKEKYKTLYSHIKSKVNSLSRKIKQLEKERNDADKYSSYKEIGETLYFLSSSENENELLEYIKTIPNYDNTISVSDNAQQYFKKYKKANRSKDYIDEQIELAKSSLDEQSFLLSSYPYLNDDELLELNETLFKIKRRGKPLPTYLPSYVIVDGSKIAFGKNDKQNDYLTFKLAHKEHTYLHLDKYHGAHVIIMNDNPTNEMKLVASEIALLLSNKNEGDILYSKVSDIKKGQKPGLVYLSKYNLITLREIRNSTKDLLMNAKRFTN